MNEPLNPNWQESSAPDTGLRSVNAPGRWSCLLFDSELLQVGAMRQFPDSPMWGGGHDTGPGFSLGFPQRAMEYQRDNHDWVVGSANGVFLNNPFSQYQRRKIDPAGEYTEWFRFDFEAGLEVIRHHDPGSAERGPQSVRSSLAYRTGTLFKMQRRLHASLRNDPLPDPMEIEEAAFRLLDRTVRSALEADGRSSIVQRASTARAHRAIAHDASRFIAANFRAPLDAAEIARAACTSRPSLFRAFRSCTGMTVHRFLTVLRLREAFGQLENTSLPITELAFALGFSSHAHLSSSFQREFGTTPMSVRGASQDPS